MNKDLNLANSIFEGFNDKNGLMICGYEWGEESESKGQEVIIDMTRDCTFSNKSLRYGDVANSWIKYDKRIRIWFSMWGHPLNEDGLGNDFDKMIVQTNWALESKEKSSPLSFYLKDENIDNFIKHIEELKPRVILFMGSQLLTKLLRSSKVWGKFTSIMGEQTENIRALRMPEYNGSLAYVNKFENCVVVGLPHPSGGHGIRKEYIEFIGFELDDIISQFKKERGIYNIL